jgi:hypothetical protein
MLGLLLWPASAAPPVISLIEPYLTNQVLLHFDVEANTRCFLQYSDKFPTNGAPATTWSNLYAPPKLIFFEHYIVPDYRTNKMRFYRLMITP